MQWKVIREYPDTETELQWFEFLPNSTYSSHYTSPGFHKMPYWEGRNPFSVLVLDKDKIVGVACSFYEERKATAGLAVRPQVAFARDTEEIEVAKTMLDGFLNVIGKDGELITLHSMTKIDAFEKLGFNVKKAEGSMETVILDLSIGSEEIFKKFSQSRRSDIRKAIRQDKMQIKELETLEELKELHEIHLGWCEYKELEPETYEEFKTAWEQKDYIRIFIAKTEGKVIAGSIFRFCKGGLIEYSANNSLPEYRNLRPNDVIVWKAIEWSVENGFLQFSMGSSHLFLRRFGGELKSSYRYQLDRTLFKKHLTKEAISDIAVKTYQSLPVGTQQKIKRVLGRH